MHGEFQRKIDELVERSHGRIRADAAHEKLVALGYLGSSRTTRRWVAAPSGGGGGVGTAVSPGRGPRSPACGCSLTMATDP
jgi:hypothetical protein